MHILLKIISQLHVKASKNFNFKNTTFSKKQNKILRKV